ncbi:phosphotransferase [Telmatobacter sp. DSM 110680]|uniref:Phosphotransferase n=1 Tax=Telmatobacter sp. DSM 110680 TaxID=3036704 RepID=A0AAU7DMK7_9BACT
MNESTKAHGLDGSLVEPDWPPLTLSEVRAVLAKMPEVSEPVEILSASPRPFSAASVVRTSRGNVFVKRHARSVRDVEGLMEEHRFMKHLRKNGVEVPRVFTADTEETAVEIGDWTYEVHDIPNGIDSYEDAISWTPFRSVDHARSAGEMLARLHVAAGSYNAPRRKPRPLVASFTIFASDDPLKAFETYASARPALVEDEWTRRDFEEALTLLQPFHEELKPLLVSLQPLWTHNDLHASNFFWSDKSRRAQAVSVIDFGLVDRTAAVYDLTQAIERNVVDWLVLMRDTNGGEDVSVHLDDLWALLEGYEGVRPLSRAEAHALVPMLALCHAEFALTEADYFVGVLYSAEKARIASRDYLVGHARWFSGPGRRKILEPLRQWAESRERLAVRA